MPTLRCIIVDDEPLPLELLSDYVNKTPFLELAGKYTNPLEALSALHQQPIDLIFLDIQMPELSGIQFIQLAGEKTRVIFTTAYPNYALQGYELNVIDYLLKPVSFERFLKAATRAQHSIHRPASISGEVIVEPVTANGQVLFIKSGYKIVKITLPEILYVEGLKEYIAIHTMHEKVLALETMKKIEEALPATHFVRVHKSFIVAIDKIDSIQRNRIYIKQSVIPIGDTYKETFLKLLDHKNLL